MFFSFFCGFVSIPFGAVHFDPILKRIERQIFDNVKNMRNICLISTIHFKIVVIVDYITAACHI